ncbi:MAG: hypothetical protein D6757_10395 [Alphaproteobacteria bacterium]|nr:MAG: hypothetical protein D6757_10395 [Alphaproteobacteria bacterium]
MTATLAIEIDHSHGAMLRVLGMIERRGWRVKALTMMPAGNAGQHMTIALEPQPWRPGSLEVLKRQIARLLCVRAIENGAEPRIEPGAMAAGRAMADRTAVQRVGAVS